jgi:ribosomal protein S18 acetylase RimI-like enzyme
MLEIPITARISWNTFDNKTVQRDDQESIFLATFDDLPSGHMHKYQIDYSYYNRGRYEGAPTYMLHVYAYGKDFESYSDTTQYSDIYYDDMDSAEGDINHWLAFFHQKVNQMTVTTENKKDVFSTISLHLIFKATTPQYVLDFFTEGKKNDELPSVLYGYGFRFDNKPNFSEQTTMFCEQKEGRYYLSIYHKFDFETEAAQGYWFVGGLAQYAEDDDMAGYIKHTSENASNQVFGFRDSLCFWQNGIDINFRSSKYKKPDLITREMTAGEAPFLETMLYQAIYTPEGSKPPEKTIIFEPILHHYIKDFGGKDDICMVAQIHDTLIGAVWSRLFSNDERGYGFVDIDTPEISMAIEVQHRNSGVGAVLLYDFLGKLCERGYKQASLSVDLRNYAFPFYRKMGFEIVRAEGNTAVMVYKF